MEKINFNIQGLDDIGISSVEHLLPSQEFFDRITIDLGLPSGTLWSKYNLGVNIENLRYEENWYGDYYAWGEIIEKKNYVWDTYKWCKSFINPYLTKYCSNGDFGYVDEKTKLELEDDVARIMFCGKWRIPSTENFKELVEYTNNQYVEDYRKVYGLNGLILTSKINGRSIFFPFSGVKKGRNGVQNEQIIGQYWTNQLNLRNPNNANSLCINNKEILMSNCQRYCGLSIRPIMNKNLQF